MTVTVYPKRLLQCSDTDSNCLPKAIVTMYWYWQWLFTSSDCHKVLILTVTVYLKRLSQSIDTDSDCLHQAIVTKYWYWQWQFTPSNCHKLFIIFPLDILFFLSYRSAVERHLEKLHVLIWTSEIKWSISLLWHTSIIDRFTDEFNSILLAT